MNHRECFPKQIAWWQRDGNTISQQTQKGPENVKSRLTNPKI